MTNNKLFILITAIFIPLVLFLISPVYSSLFSNEKTMSYALMHTKDLTEDYKEGDSWSKLSTSFDGVQLESAYISRIIIANSGTIPISRNDFDSDVTIEMGEGVGVLGVRVEESTPSNLDIDHYFQEGLIGFKGLLLNPNDNFVLEVLSKKRPDLISVQSRIAGIDSPREIDYKKSDGVYLKRVKHESVAVSHETTVLRINFYLTGIISLISVFASITSIRSFSNKRSIVYVSLYIPYILSVVVSIMSLDSLLIGFGLEHKTLRGVLTILVIFIPVFIGFANLNKKTLTPQADK